ncbi:MULTISPECIES: PTS mannose/fructose/sorbose transporter subunit IIAB [unclassified Enterococcus]|uniref:PTS mannose/fructose/sorbose transporter subunit IIAB n=1 Tax=unclassified Enterococcus TaxID=2608891 RepID=UPI001552B995|nr:MULTISPECIES: PTS mannose/fructose/sorbose transporter subunit IIAB [unclassified Enterococcus]MBS7577004.1 PTS sugar transporter subunit IIB [Enterococcus sp. MMGLQ5-2]MBS7584549.1 PTS sugar transporter subunit IIB [Enterococcus sp. MMGLQ5-1]NPD12404.1 PTS transporter subunit IIB [Enterococcus sp. MMGLQ5-1]NPD36838.1 PTS transporter subunit IIB [Enterococcus sp. MMGLQ5-2]
MKKFLVAGHGKLADGVKATLELFLGENKDFTYISAYTDDVPDLDDALARFIESISDTDQAIIFTDLYGGSVNQKVVMKTTGKTNFFVIAGMNIPLILETVSIALAGEEYTYQKIQTLVETARLELKQVQLVEGVQGTGEQSAQAVTDMTEAVKSKTIDNLLVRPETNKMITMRIDERLIHGQIAMVWTKELKIEGIIVANDEVVTNELQENALRMAAPNGIKVLMRTIDEAADILNDNRSATKNILVLVRTVHDAARLAGQVSYFNRINVGNVGKMIEGEKKKIAPTVLLTAPELASLEELVGIFPKTDIQMVPAEKKELAKELI